LHGVPLLLQIRAMIALLDATQSAWFLAAVVPATFVVLLWVGRWLKRRQGVRLGVTYQVFAIAAALYLAATLYHRAFTYRDQLVAVLESVLVFFGAFVLIALIRRYVWEFWFERKRKGRAPKFLGELVALIILFAAVVAALQLLMQKSIPGLLAGSGIAAAIIGFAMQDLLGNIIAGIAIEVGKPFKPGDWLLIGEQRAEVIEVNWRSTRLRTNDDICLDIPNKSIVGSTITNLTYPTAQHGIRLEVRFDYRISPTLVKDCMVRAAAHAPGVLASPPPKVFLKAFAESAITYEIKFWIENEAIFNDIVDAIRTNVWYEAQRNNIRMPFPIRTVQIERPKARHDDTLQQARSAVGKQAFLQLLDADQTDQLLKDAKLLRFGRGEIVIEQGDHGESMFMLLQGEADVFVSANGSKSHVATLKSGDYFGEMSLLTGEPRSATVRATRDCEILEIEKETFAEILHENEALVQKLSELLAKRRMETEGILAANTERANMTAKQREYTEGFLRKLYSFFEL
jgi:small-conductance mechanosensitive channel/CRP-like cAMP-binding protein